MVAGGDIGLIILRVAVGDRLFGELEGRVADDAGLAAGGVAFDVIDVGLVERPGVHAPLGPVLGIDGSFVVAKGLGPAVRVAGVQPSDAGIDEVAGAGVGEERVDGFLEVAANVVGVGVGAVNEVRVVVNDEGAVGEACGAGRLLRAAMPIAAGGREQGGDNDQERKRADHASPVVENNSQC